MHFFDVHHDVFNGPDGNNFLCASCILIHSFYLHIVSLKMTLNNKMYGSEYNAGILKDRIKAYYHFDLPNNARTVVSDTTNAATKVAEYFSKDTEQVNCEIYQLNIALNYGFGLLENTRSTISVDDNGLRIKLNNSKWMRVSEIVTNGGTFPQYTELI